MAITAEKIHEHFDALNSHDFDRVTSIVADDYVGEYPQSGELIRGKHACLAIYRNYPGGSPSMKVHRITGGGDKWVAELAMDYGGRKVFGVSILEFRGDKLVHQTDYWGDPFPAPEWRIQWVEKMEPAVPA